MVRATRRSVLKAMGAGGLAANLPLAAIAEAPIYAPVPKPRPATVFEADVFEPDVFA